MHGVLASLPKMTPDALQRFAQQLLGTGSEKAQRDLTKKMLVSSTGGQCTNVGEVCGLDNLVVGTGSQKCSAT